ncbi:hypothetical protein [Flectobacillus longus]|uniref:hypothetical protein n=1 Tax=Flectobacillus longus TaxID=2984207 RepID=UPI0024B872AD|nr:hypothetical protein [Flectobacillus longus]MDI9882186.1 hypothetical protein [Flectobacillus longus]
MIKGVDRIRSIALLRHSGIFFVKAIGRSRMGHCIAGVEPDDLIVLLNHAIPPLYWSEVSQPYSILQNLQYDSLMLRT